MGISVEIQEVLLLKLLTFLFNQMTQRQCRKRTSHDSQVGNPTITKELDSMPFANSPVYASRAIGPAPKNVFPVHDVDRYATQGRFCKNSSTSYVKKFGFSPDIESLSTDDSIKEVQFLENNTFDLALLMVCPERRLEVFKMLTMAYGSKISKSSSISVFGNGANKSSIFISRHVEAGKDFPTEVHEMVLPTFELNDPVSSPSVNCGRMKEGSVGILLIEPRDSRLGFLEVFFTFKGTIIITEKLILQILKKVATEQSCHAPKSHRAGLAPEAEKARENPFRYLVVGLNEISALALEVGTIGSPHIPDDELVKLRTFVAREQSAVIIKLEGSLNSFRRALSRNKFFVFGSPNFARNCFISALARSSCSSTVVVTFFVCALLRVSSAQYIGNQFSGGGAVVKNNGSFRKEVVGRSRRHCSSEWVMIIPSGDGINPPRIRRNGEGSEGFLQGDEMTAPVGRADLNEFFNCLGGRSSALFASVVSMGFGGSSGIEGRGEGTVSWGSALAPLEGDLPSRE
ncbi:hypothetical protein FXO38_15704 [Capsicum annuum]|nr:hypothetical protein FXO38_15704 [Capsicum annuum]